jgi:CheY-like chemotaxis protein
MTLRALVVDDDPISLKLLIRIFQKRGWSVEACASGGAALRVLEQSAFDILVTDHQMPEMTGVALARHANDLSPTMPCVVVSGCPRDPDAGAVLWLNKPVDVTALFGVLDELSL